ncbi:MAG: transporter [Bacteroidales bacterium]
MFVGIIYSTTAYAQACCSGGVPLGGSLGLGAADSKSMQVLFTYDYNAINDLVHISNRLDDDTRSRTTQSGIVELNYGINQRFSITTVLPFIRQTRSINTYDDSKDFIAVQGLGDAVFLVKYRLVSPDILRPFQWVIGAGPKFPTGKTDFTNLQGFALAADMQPGSGSFDGLAWSYMQRDRLLSPNLGISSVAVYRYSGTNNNYNEVQTYRFGNEFQLSLGLNYDLFVGLPVTMFLFTRYRHQTADLIDGNVFPSSGGQWIYAIPGLNIQFLNGLSLRLSSEWPIYRALVGTQLTTGVKFSAALSVTFPSRENKILVQKH